MPSETTTSSRYSTSNVDYQLATIDAGANPPDSLVDRYAAALDRAETKCDQERRMIGDMATRAMQLIAEDFGKEVTTLEIIQGIDGAIPDGQTMDCAEIVAVMTVLIGSD